LRASFISNSISSLFTSFFTLKNCVFCKVVHKTYLIGVYTTTNQDFLGAKNLILFTLNANILLTTWPVFEISPIPSCTSLVQEPTIRCVEKN